MRKYYISTDFMRMYLVNSPATQFSYVLDS